MKLAGSPCICFGTVSEFESRVNTAPPPKRKKKDQTTEIALIFAAALALASTLLWFGLTFIYRDADTYVESYGGMSYYV
jgi:hypothetical protein